MAFDFQDAGIKDNYLSAQSLQEPVGLATQNRMLSDGTARFGLDRLEIRPESEAGREESKAGETGLDIDQTWTGPNTKGEKKLG